VEDFRIGVHLSAGELTRTLAADAVAGLTASPKWLPPKWFYDERGSALFDQITRLPEYYPTRREKQILESCAGQIAAASRADTLVELGSGTSEKTRWLLTALRAAGTLGRYVPVDVDEVTIERAGLAIAAAYPGLEVEAVCADFERHLDVLPTGGRRLVAMLGGTIGNLRPDQRKDFFAQVSTGMQPGDCLLLGTDLVKDTGRLVAAYDDRAGVTAEFNRNVLRVLNHQLAADFDPQAFDHLALFDHENEWIEMHLVAREAMVCTVAAVDLEVRFGAGERLRTEISAKFRRERVEGELADAGLRLTHWWTDPAGDYALSLARLG